MPNVVRKERVDAFRIDGAWAALFILNLGVGPDPLCPFLLIALTQPNNNWMGKLTLAYIHALDPSAARTLAPVFAMSADLILKLPGDSNHPGLLRVLMYLTMEVSFCICSVYGHWLR